MILRLPLIFLCLVAIPVGAQDTQTIRVLAMDLAAQGDMGDLAKVVGQAVAQQAATKENYELISTDEIRAVLQNEALKQNMGCDTTSCLAELAAALDAKLIISGHIAKTEDQTVLLSLSLIDVREMKTLNRVQMRHRGAEAELVRLGELAAIVLCFPKKAAQTGSIRLVERDSQTQVILDGSDVVAELREESLAGLAVGPHEINFAQEGFQSKTQALLVGPEEHIDIDATLVPLPFYEGPIFWASLGAGLLVIMAAGFYSWQESQWGSVWVAESDTSLERPGAVETILEGATP